MRQNELARLKRDCVNLIKSSMMPRQLIGCISHFEGDHTMKKLVLIAITSMLALSACNTISGAGKDVSAAGSAVSNAAQNVKEKM